MKKLLVIILGAVIAALLLTCIGCTKQPTIQPVNPVKIAPINPIDHSKLCKAWIEYKRSADSLGIIINGMVASSGLRTFYFDGTYQFDTSPKGSWAWVNDTTLTTDITKINPSTYIYVALLNDTAFHFYIIQKIPNMIDRKDIKWCKPQ